MGKFGSTGGTTRSIRAMSRQMYNYARRLGRDRKGVTRHSAGSFDATLFGYLPVTPTPGLVCISPQLWNFQTPGDVVTDQVDPVNFMWEEQYNTGGIGAEPLQLINGPGGAARIVTGSGLPWRAYCYVARTETISLDRAVWFNVDFTFDATENGEFYFGLLRNYDPEDIAYDDAPNSVGFYVDPGAWDLRVIVSSTRGGGEFRAFYRQLADIEPGVRTSLGIKFMPDVAAESAGPGHTASCLYFYMGDKLICKLPSSVTVIPEGLLSVTFGVVSRESDESSTMTIHSMMTAIESSAARCGA